MATTFNTRISLKYDTYAAWMEKDPVLLSGEVAIVVVPAETGAVAKEPAILFKVGDGTSKFSKLQFVSGVAADVYDWAKAAAKPTYTANEIDGLADYISGKVQDTNTQYKLEQDTSNTHTLKLYKKDLDDADWSIVTTITTADTVYDDTDLSGRVTKVENRATALETLVGSTAVATQIANAIAALNLADTYEAKGAAKAVQGETTATVKSVEDSVAQIKDGKTIDSFADVETALAGKQATGDYATKTEAQGYANAKDTAIAAAKKAGDDAQADVDALKTKVGTVPDNKTVVQMIEDAQTAATYDDTAIKERVTAVEGKATTLIGEDANKSARTIAAEEVAKIVDGADSSFDTLKEIADWISGHKTDAASMNSAIVALEAIVKGIGGSGEEATVVAYVAKAIDALKIGDYAKAADLTALAGRVSTLETELPKKANDSDLKTVAKSGDIADLTQADGYIVFNCGSASVNI